MAAATVVAPVWSRFLSTYPDVHLEVCVDETIVDLVAKDSIWESGRATERRWT
jgi:DNA-binding transcriptional LysR family regulator